MAKKKTHEEFVQQIFERFGNHFSLESKYKNSTTKVKIKHIQNDCNYEWEALPNNFLKQKGCPKCLGMVKKTTESFRKEIYEKVGNEYTVLGEYINTNEKILMKHNFCGHEWGAIPFVFLKGSRCPQCAIEINANKLRKTQEEFVQQVYDLVGDEYEVNGEYINANVPVELFHKTCNRTWKVQPSNFLVNNARCFYCAGKESKTHEEFIEEVYEKYGEEYTVLGKYITTSAKIKIKHNICGKINEPTPNNFLKGHGCGYCSKNVQWTHEQFVNKVAELEGDKYTVLTNYINNHTKIKIRHNKCGKEYNVAPSHFLNGKRCKACRIKEKTKTHEEFVAEVYELIGDEYSVLSKYKTTKTKIKMRHNVCGHEYEVKPYGFLQGKRCGKCNASHGELAIAKWLTDHNAKFETEFIVEGCKYINHLPFDCAIFLKDNSFILIEYQGKQHHEPIDFYGGEKTFKATQKRDKIKKDFCEKNNIPLLIIDYWDFDNIDQILEKELSHLDLPKVENQLKQLELIF